MVDDRLALLDWKAENDEQPDPGGVEIPVRLFQVIQTWQAQWSNDPVGHRPRQSHDHRRASEILKPHHLAFG